MFQLQPRMLAHKFGEFGAEFQAKDPKRARASVVATVKVAPYASLASHARGVRFLQLAAREDVRSDMPRRAIGTGRPNPEHTSSEKQFNPSLEFRIGSRDHHRLKQKTENNGRMAALFYYSTLRTARRAQ